MMDISALTNQLIVLFFISVLGYAGIKLKLLSPNTNKVVADLVIHIANPCTLLVSVLGGARTLSNQEVGILTAVAVGTYLVAILLGKLVPKLLRVPKRQAGAYEFMTVFSNIGFIGIPVVSALFGPDAVFLVAVFNLMFNLLCYTYGISLMAPKEKGRAFSLRTLLTPINIASVAAYIFYLFGITAPPLIYSALETVSGLTSPAAMLCLGCAMAGVKLREMFTNVRLYLFSAIKLILIPLVMYALTFWWMDNELMLGVTVVMWALPAGSIVTMLAAKYDADEALPASAVSMTTLLCMVTIPVLLWILF